MLPKSIITAANGSTKVQFTPLDNGSASVIANQNTGVIANQNTGEITQDKCWEVLLSFLAPDLRCVLHLQQLLSHKLPDHEMQVEPFLDNETSRWGIQCKGKEGCVHVMLDSESIVCWSSENPLLRTRFPSLPPLREDSFDNPLATAAEEEVEQPVTILAHTLLFALVPSLCPNPTEELEEPQSES
jgi:hypothetical protein